MPIEDLVSIAGISGSEGSEAGTQAIVDALQEPFWPEGLGINRGFLHVLDCADLAHPFAPLERSAEHLAVAAATTYTGNMMGCIIKFYSYNIRHHLKFSSGG